MDLLELVDIGKFHEARVERDRADVVEARAGHRRAVDLRLHHGPVHRVPFAFATAPASTHVPVPSVCRVTLSINRVVPTRAASASNTVPSTRSTGLSSAASRAS